MPPHAKLPVLTPREARAAARASQALNDGRRLMTIPEAGEYLQKSRDTVYRLIRAGELRSFKISGTLRIRPSDLDAYIERHPAS